MNLHSPRVIGVAAAALVFAGWLLGSTLSPPVARTQERGAARRTPAAPKVTAIAPLADVDAATVRPAPPAPRRNPFTFGRGELAPRLRADTPSAESETDAAAAPVAAVEPWRLMGVAVDADGGITAIVSGLGDVHLLRPGDQLPGGVAVVEVTGAGAQLRRADGTLLDLRLP